MLVSVLSLAALAMLLSLAWTCRKFSLSAHCHWICLWRGQTFPPVLVTKSRLKQQTASMNIIVARVLKFLWNETHDPQDFSPCVSGNFLLVCIWPLVHADPHRRIMCVIHRWLRYVNVRLLKKMCYKNTNLQGFCQAYKMSVMEKFWF